VEEWKGGRLEVPASIRAGFLLSFFHPCRFPALIQKVSTYFGGNLKHALTMKNQDLLENRIGWGQLDVRYGIVRGLERQKELLYGFCEIARCKL
jgi:hypothetical protein